jgi:hypothetical protein
MAAQLAVDEQQLTITDNTDGASGEPTNVTIAAPPLVSVGHVIYFRYSHIPSILLSP